MHSCMSSRTHLQQSNLDNILDEIDVLSTLATVQVVGGDMQRDFRGPQSVLQTKFLLAEQVCLGDDVCDFSLQFRLPVVDVMKSLGQALGVCRLSPQRKCLRLLDHVACNMAHLEKSQVIRQQTESITITTRL